MFNKRIMDYTAEEQNSMRPVHEELYYGLKSKTKGFPDVEKYMAAALGNYFGNSGVVYHFSSESGEDRQHLEDAYEMALEAFQSYLAAVDMHWLNTSERS